MSANDLLIFWSDCANRRRGQLVMHKRTLEALYNDASIYGEMFTEQKRWCAEAQQKLQHAERMVQFFECVAKTVNQKV